jgi:phosphoglycolate phosphatase-like HAD superfamily hydrolase
MVMNQGNRSIIIDVDDTVLNLGDRRIELYKRHFPRAEVDENEIRRDVELSFLGDRESHPSKGFLRDLFDQEVVSKIPLSAVAGSVEAITTLVDKGINIVFITGRHKSLREDTVDSLERIGIVKGSYLLHMDNSDNPTDPANAIKEQNYKESLMKSIASNAEVIAAIGDRLSDIRAAVEAKVPAILFDSTSYQQSEWQKVMSLSHVGLERCSSWDEVMFVLGQFEVGSSQMERLRESFTNQYSSWLQNLNTLSAIDVTIATLLAAFSSQAIMNTGLHGISRTTVAFSLIMSLLSLIFAIRAFTARYTSGKSVNESIIPKLKQVYYILIDRRKGANMNGDAIDEYLALKKASQFDQSRAHLDFFFQRYGTYNPRALLNLRLYEMRAVNYAKAYPEHISSTILVWNITFLVVWVICVAAWDPSLEIDLSFYSEAESITEGAVKPADSDVTGNVGQQRDAKSEIYNGG